MSSFVFRITNAVKQKTKTIVDGLVQKDEWTELPTHPWRRFLARMFDLTIICLFLSILIGMAIFFISESAVDPTEKDYLLLILSSPVGQILFGVLFFFVVGLIIVVISTYFGTTLGKWLFGVKVLNAKNNKLSFKEVKSREIAVWFEGLAFCIPFIALFTLSSAYKKVADNKKTSWDKYDDFKVVYRNLNFKQLFLSFLGSFLLIFFLIIYYALSFPHKS